MCNSSRGPSIIWMNYTINTWFGHMRKEQWLLFLQLCASFLCFVLITVTVRVLQPPAVCSNHALQLTRTLQLCLVKPGKHVLLCINNTGVNSAQSQILCSYTLLLYNHHSYLLVHTCREIYMAWNFG